MKVADHLKNLSNLYNLAISLTDERYGTAGHGDSNWQQLVERGFSLPGARLLPVLDGSSLEANAKSYSELLDMQLAWCDFSLALAGMGADGHIFGIKPGSPAVKSDSDVVGYAWDDFKRMTPTAALICRLDEIVVYAMGKEKHSQLEKLNQPLSDDSQPAQILKRAKKVTIYNDWSKL